MKISIFTSMTDPEKRMDPWEEALNCYESFADEVVIVGDEWEQEFKWGDVNKILQRGFNESTGDWVIWMDIDNFFHEKDFDYIKNFLSENSDKPAVAFPKYQIFTPDRFHIKSVICRALNKKNFNNILLNGGGDMCLPTLNNNLIDPNTSPVSKAAIWNYDTVFKTKKIIADDRAKFARGWFREFGNYGDRGGGTPEEAYAAWFEMVSNRYKDHKHPLKLNDHPKFIKNKLETLKISQFGYEGFGLKQDNFMLRMRRLFS